MHDGYRGPKIFTTLTLRFQDFQRKHANTLLIETLEESLVIAEEGKKARSLAVIELQNCEEALRKTLASAKAARPVTASAE
jgi:hypothetical protein